MAAVILILGLIAAGVYTSNGWFYVAAVVGGGFYALLILIVISVAASVKSGFKDFDSKFKSRM